MACVTCCSNWWRLRASLSADLPVSQSGAASRSQGRRTIELKPRGVKAGGIGTSASTSAWRLQALHERGDEIRDEAIVGGRVGSMSWTQRRWRRPWPIATP
jgi:hypothetical protein